MVSINNRSVEKVQVSQFIALISGTWTIPFEITPTPEIQVLSMSPYAQKETRGYPAMQSNIPEHLSWDASLILDLDNIRIGCGNHDNFDLDRITWALHRYGFALLSGLSIDNQPHIAADRLLKLSQQLGDVIQQSPRDEMIEDIRDFSDVDEKDDRGYRSAGELSPHSDPPTLITLHCLIPAMSGGESYLVNVRRIHDAIEKHHPDLLEVLYQGFPHWIVEGQKGGPGPSPDDRPVFMRKNNRISCVLYRPFIELAADALKQPLNPQQIKALDVFEEYANHNQFALRFFLQPGETLILHNRTVLHARTDYKDWPEMSKRRHLLRSWIDAPDLLPVSEEHALGNIFDD